MARTLLKRPLKAILCLPVSTVTTFDGMRVRPAIADTELTCDANKKKAAVTNVSRRKRTNFLLLLSKLKTPVIEIRRI